MYRLLESSRRYCEFQLRKKSHLYVLPNRQSDLQSSAPSSRGVLFCIFQTTDRMGDSPLLALQISGPLDQFDTPFALQHRAARLISPERFGVTTPTSLLLLRPLPPTRSAPLAAANRYLE